ncbi:hypothetical protein [Priestia aryabhattai]
MNENEEYLKKTEKKPGDLEYIVNAIKTGNVKIISEGHPLYNEIPAIRNAVNYHKADVLDVKGYESIAGIIPRGETPSIVLGEEFKKYNSQEQNLIIEHEMGHYMFQHSQQKGRTDIKEYQADLYAALHSDNIKDTIQLVRSLEKNSVPDGQKNYEIDRRTKHLENLDMEKNIKLEGLHNVEDYVVHRVDNSINEKDLQFIGPNEFIVNSRFINSYSNQEKQALIAYENEVYLHNGNDREIKLRGEEKQLRENVTNFFIEELQNASKEDNPLNVTGQDLINAQKKSDEIFNKNYIQDSKELKGIGKFVGFTVHSCNNDSDLSGFNPKVDERMMVHINQQFRDTYKENDQRVIAVAKAVSMYELGIKPGEQSTADLKIQLAIRTHTMAESKVDNKKNFNENFLETFKREQLAYKKQAILGNNINPVDVELTRTLIKAGETFTQSETLEKQTVKEKEAKKHVSL